MNGANEPRVRQDNIIERVRRHLDSADGNCRDRDLPYITLTYAQSIDGCIARFEGETLQLSNPFARKLTHQVRALHDAILVGINTVLRDDPRLTVRLVQGKNPQPVIVDSRLRFPLRAKLLNGPCVRPIIVTSHAACEDKERRLKAAGARVIRASEQADGLIDLAQMLRQLKELGLASVMVEGGASIITNVLVSRLADQFLLTISPRFVGGLRAVKSRDSAYDRMPRLRNLHYQWLAEDLILRGDLAAADEQADEQTEEQLDPHAVYPAPPLGHAHKSGGADGR
jgi:3,4-dihydroxy 2-butanone 4-phosphate synthase/GTP cyclohydrolase II